MTEKQEKKFDKLLDPEWMAGMRSAQRDGVDAAIRTAAMNMVVLEMAKLEDEDLIRLQDELATAREVYTEGKKENLAKIEFLIEVLREQGCTTLPAVADFLKRAAAAAGDKPTTAEAIAAAAGKKLREKLSKAAGPGGRVTISTPSGKSVVVNGE